MEIMLWALNLAWKVLVVCMGWMLFRYIVKNGKGTFGELLDTISAVLRTMGHAIRKMCLNYLKKEESEAKAGTNETDPAFHAEYLEYLKEISNNMGTILTFDEFCKKRKEKEDIVLD